MSVIHSTPQPGIAERIRHPIRHARAWSARLGQTLGLVAARWEAVVYPLMIFVASRLLVFAAGIFGDVFLPTEAGHWVADPNSPFLSLWAKWDSQWYVQIMRDGYWFQPLRQSNVAFFPLYPMTTLMASAFVGGNVILAGFVVSNLALAGALIFLYKLTELELACRESARRAVAYLAFFPTAFFFSAVYTESLFLLLSLACIYFARRRWWLAAAIAGMLAALTRNIGVVLWLPVMWEWLRSQGWRWDRLHAPGMWRTFWARVKAHWPEALLTVAIPLGLVLFMAFLKFNFDRPFAFIETQAAWNRQQIGPIAVLTRELDKLADFELNKGELSRLMNVGAVLAVLATVPFIWRRLGEGYALYVMILVLIPTSSAVASMIRYVLVLFPVFILLGWWGRWHAVDRIVLTAFAVGLGVLTAVFANWIFVA